MRRYRELLHRTDGPPGSAWGEYGPDDELGSIGRLTPDRALAGAACVRTGEVFNLDLPMDALDPPLAAARRTVRHTIFGRNAFHRDEHLDDFFPQVSSQIDGLRHFGHPDHGFYNGASGERLVPGDPLLGMQHWAEHGIVGRAVLVDVARAPRRRGAADRPPGGRADPGRRRRRRGRTPGQPVRARRPPAPALRVAAPLPHGDDRGRAQRAARRAPPSRAPPVPRHVGVVVGQRVRARRGGQLRPGVLAAGGDEPVPHRGRAGGRDRPTRTPASCTG